MKKKSRIIISAITVLTIALSINLTCFAATDSQVQAPSSNSSSTYITDRATLDQYVSDHGMQIPEGKTLESLKITVVNDPTLVANANTMAVQPESTNGLVTLENNVFSHYAYYGDQPFVVDQCYGPLATGPKITLTTSETAGYDGSLGVTAADITASFGVNFSTSWNLSREIQFDPVPAGKVLQYSAFVNYSVYNYDVIFGGGTLLGTGSYWVPIGIVITQVLLG